MDWLGFSQAKENTSVKTYSRVGQKKKQTSLFGGGYSGVQALADHHENVPFSKRKDRMGSPTKKDMKKLRSRRENPDSPR
jgi:hypothetical protein